MTPGAELDVSVLATRSPFEHTASAKLLENAQAAAADLGLPPLETARSGGGSDGNITASLGIPTLDGLGAIGAHPHNRNEHIDVTSLPTRAALLAALVARLQAAPS